MDDDLEILSPEKIISGGEGEEELCDEEFYEKIEAPKFVDFTVPERRHPDDDRYWFCMRVGCDQKHEEEIDPEAIYNNFVLRVMAARSPNVRFGRALQRKALSTNVKCPQTAPPKSSRPRAPRLEMISSISQMVGAKVKGKPPLAKLSATPNARRNKPDVGGGMALTTPRNKKRVSNPHPFRSVRKPEALDVGLPKNKVVAKTLVFHSPKKTVKLKASLELNTPLRKICSGMKKLEITSQRKHAVVGCNKPLPLDASRKKLSGREVRSRFFDSLHCKGQDTKSSRCVKKKELKQCESRPHEHDSSDMEIDERSRKGSLDVHTPGNCKNNAENVSEKSLTNSKNLEPVSENSAEVMSNDSGDNGSSNSHAGDSKNEKRCDEVIESSSEEKKIHEGREGDDHDQENDEKENASVSDVKENHDEVMESDDKENASAPDANREHDHARSTNLGKHKSSKCTQKVVKVLGKTIKDTTSTASGAQVVKYRKPKPTNPKPFRLRTDERRILKEANMEKKLHLLPLKEVTAVTRISRRKQLDAANEGSEKESQKKRTRKDQDQPRKMVSLVDPQPEHCQDIKAEKEVKDISKRTKSPLIKQPARPQGYVDKEVKATRFSSSGKAKTAPKMAPGQLSTINETSRTKLKPKKATTKPGEKDAVSAAKAPPSSTIRSLPRGSKPTIPTERSFHSIHVPKKKNCTKDIS